jgi:ribosome-binding factor A
VSPERKGGSGSARKARVEAAMREALTEAIAADIRDPRVHAPTMLTVSRVEMNVDMSVARCYISIVGDDATADAAIEGLNKAAGFLRGPIGRRLRMQHAPELRFMIDPSLDVSAKLAAIIREDEEKARAAGRDPKAEAAATPADKKAGES